MPLQRPILLDDLSRTLRGIQERSLFRRLTLIFTRSTRQLGTSNSFIRPEDAAIVNSVEEAIPPRQGAALLRDGSALREESNALMTGIREINKVSGSKQGEELETEISQALKLDQADIKRAAKRTSSHAVEDRTTGLIQTKFVLDVYDMESPYEAPKSIACYSRKCSQIMYTLVDMACRSDSGNDFAPELWLPVDQVHNLGGQGRCWRFLEGPDIIEPSATKLDVINAFRRRDYIVVAVCEDEEVIPVPVDVVRYSSKETESLGSYLRKLWSYRTILEAYRIETPEESVLNKLLDTRAFPPRKNDVFLICTNHAPSAARDPHEGTSRGK